jgi:hypothetical protein
MADESLDLSLVLYVEIPVNCARGNWTRTFLRPYSVLDLHYSFEFVYLCIYEFQVNYVLTTESEIAGGTTKIETARVKGIPLLSEDVITDSVSSGVFPDDLSDYLLEGAPKKGGSAHARPSRATKKKATLEEADEAELTVAAKKSVASLPTKMKAMLKGVSASANCFEGLTFAISGILSKPRKHWEVVIAEHGGRVSGSVTGTVRSISLPCAGRCWSLDSAVGKSSATLNARFAGPTVLCP